MFFFAVTQKRLEPNVRPPVARGERGAILARVFPTSPDTSRKAEASHGDVLSQARGSSRRSSRERVEMTNVAGATITRSRRKSTTARPRVSTLLSSGRPTLGRIQPAALRQHAATDPAGIELLETDANRAKNWTVRPTVRRGAANHLGAVPEIRRDRPEWRQSVGAAALSRGRGRGWGVLRRHRHRQSRDARSDSRTDDEPFSGEAIFFPENSVLSSACSAVRSPRHTRTIPSRHSRSWPFLGKSPENRRIRGDQRSVPDGERP